MCLNELTNACVTPWDGERCWEGKEGEAQVTWVSQTQEHYSVVLVLWSRWGEALREAAKPQSLGEGVNKPQAPPQPGSLLPQALIPA